MKGVMPCVMKFSLSSDKAPSRLFFVHSKKDFALEEKIPKTMAHI